MNSEKGLPAHELRAVQEWIKRTATEPEQRAVKAWLKQPPIERTPIARTRDVEEEYREAKEEFEELTDEYPERTGNQFDDDWNRWAREHVNFARRETREILGATIDEAGAMTGRLQRRIEDLATTAKQADEDLRAEIATLRATVEDLASEIRDIWAVIEGGDSNARSNVVPMIDLRGGKKVIYK